jgi:hypothetical protein
MFPISVPALISYFFSMEIYDIADEIQRLCRKIIETDHPAKLEQQCALLRELLREHTRRTHDQAARVLVQVLDTEHRLKHAS